MAQLASKRGQAVSGAVTCCLAMTANGAIAEVEGHLAILSLWIKPCSPSESLTSLLQ